MAPWRRLRRLPAPCRQQSSNSASSRLRQHSNRVRYCRVKRGRRRAGVGRHASSMKMVAAGFDSHRVIEVPGCGQLGYCLPNRPATPSRRRSATLDPEQSPTRPGLAAEPGMPLFRNSSHNTRSATRLRRRFGGSVRYAIAPSLLSARPVSELTGPVGGARRGSRPCRPAALAGWSRCWRARGADGRPRWIPRS